MKRITVAATALAASAALALAGCSSDNDSKSSSTAGGSTDKSTSTETGGETALTPFEAGSKIGIALPEKTSQNWVDAENYFKQYVTEAGFEPVIQFSTGGGPSEQQQQIDAMITQGVKVLVIGALDGGQLGAQAEAAKKAGIYVIAYDRLLTNTPDVDQYIAFDPFKVGQKQGQSLLDGLAAEKGSGPYNIELIAGSPDDANSAKFFDGAIEVLQPKIDDGTVKVLSGQTKIADAATQGWKAENAQTRFSSIMTSTYQTEELHGILSPNDTLARAALTAVEQAGKSYIPIATGQDSEDESVKWILEGKQYSTIYKSTDELVKTTVEAIKALSEGKTPEINDTESYDNGSKIVPAYLLEPTVVTKDNAKEVYANDPILKDVVAKY